MKQLLISLTMMGFLSACGGGGGGSSDPSPTVSAESESGSDTVSSEGTPSGQLPPSGTDSASGNTGTSVPGPVILTTSGEDVNIPANVTSVATQMSEVAVPANFSYDSVDTQDVTVDIRSYSLSKGYVSIYGSFERNEDGSYRADYNSRITSTTVNAGTASLRYQLADSQYYMLAEVYFYDGTTPIQTRINNQQDSWVW